MENKQQPRNIFEQINQNIVELSEDLNVMHGKIDQIMAALYPSDQDDKTKKEEE